MRDINPDFCKELVYHERCGTSQCSRRPKRDGLCTQHHPDAVAARKAQSMARYREERDRWGRQRQRDEAGEKVVEAAVAFVHAGDGGESMNAWTTLEQAVEKWEALQ